MGNLTNTTVVRKSVNISTNEVGMYSLLLSLASYYVSRVYCCNKVKADCGILRGSLTFVMA